MQIQGKNDSLKDPPMYVNQGGGGKGLRPNQHNQQHQQQQAQHHHHHQSHHQIHQHHQQHQAQQPQLQTGSLHQTTTQSAGNSHPHPHTQQVAAAPPHQHQYPQHQLSISYYQYTIGQIPNANTNVAGSQLAPSPPTHAGGNGSQGGQIANAAATGAGGVGTGATNAVGNAVSSGRQGSTTNSMPHYSTGNPIMPASSHYMAQQFMQMPPQSAAVMVTAPYNNAAVAAATVGGQHANPAAGQTGATIYQAQQQAPATATHQPIYLATSPGLHRSTNQHPMRPYPHPSQFIVLAQRASLLGNAHQQQTGGNGGAPAHVATQIQNMGTRVGGAGPSQYVPSPYCASPLPLGTTAMASQSQPIMAPSGIGPTLLPNAYCSLGDAAVPSTSSTSLSMSSVVGGGGLASSSTGAEHTSTKPRPHAIPIINPLTMKTVTFEPQSKGSAALDITAPPDADNMPAKTTTITLTAPPELERTPKDTNKYTTASSGESNESAAVETAGGQQQAENAAGAGKIDQQMQTDVIKDNNAVATLTQQQQTQQQPAETTTTQTKQSGGVGGSMAAAATSVEENDDTDADTPELEHDDEDKTTAETTNPSLAKQEEVACQQDAKLLSATDANNQQTPATPAGTVMESDNTDQTTETDVKLMSQMDDEVQSKRLQSGEEQEQHGCSEVNNLSEINKKSEKIATKIVEKTKETKGPEAASLAAANETPETDDSSVTIQKKSTDEGNASMRQVEKTPMKTEEPARSSKLNNSTSSSSNNKNQPPPSSKANAAPTSKAVDSNANQQQQQLLQQQQQQKADDDAFIPVSNRKNRKVAAKRNAKENVKNTPHQTQMMQQQQQQQSHRKQAAERSNSMTSQHSNSNRSNNNTSSNNNNNAGNNANNNNTRNITNAATVQQQQQNQHQQQHQQQQQHNLTDNHNVNNSLSSNNNNRNGNKQQQQHHQQQTTQAIAISSTSTSTSTSTNNNNNNNNANQVANAKANANVKDSENNSATKAIKIPETVDQSSVTSLEKPLDPNDSTNANAAIKHEEQTKKIANSTTTATPSNEHEEEKPQQQQQQQQQSQKVSEPKAADTVADIKEKDNKSETKTEKKSTVSPDDFDCSNAQQQQQQVPSQSSQAARPALSTNSSKTNKGLHAVTPTIQKHSAKGAAPHNFRYSLEKLKSLAQAPGSVKLPSVPYQKGDCVSQLFVSQQNKHNNAHGGGGMHMPQAYQQMNFHENMDLLGNKRRNMQRKQHDHQSITSSCGNIAGVGGAAGGSAVGMTGGSVSVSGTSFVRPMRVIRVNLSLNEEIKLSESENAWTPSTLKNKMQDPAGSPDSVEATVKKVRGVLNKLTPENFDVLLKAMTSISLDSAEKMQSVMLLIFEKTISEPNFAPTYARFCQVLFQVVKPESKQAFTTSIIKRIQMEFEENVNQADAKWKTLEPLVDRLKTCTDPKERSEIEAEIEDKEYQFRRRAWGTVRFIGELYKLKQLTPERVMTCVQQLQEHGREEKLEYMCKLLTTVGHLIDETVNKDRLDTVFAKMNETVKNARQGKINPPISSRVRFMMQDVIDLRSRQWDQASSQANKPAVAVTSTVSSSSGGGGGGGSSGSQHQQRRRNQDDKNNRNNYDRGGSSHRMGYGGSNSQRQNRLDRDGSHSGGGGNFYSKNSQKSNFQQEDKLIDFKKFNFSKCDEPSSDIKLGNTKAYMWRDCGKPTMGGLQNTSTPSMGGGMSQRYSSAGNNSNAANNNAKRPSNPFQMLSMKENDTDRPSASQTSASSSSNEESDVEEKSISTMAAEDYKKQINGFVEEYLEGALHNSFDWQAMALSTWRSNTLKQQVELMFYLLVDYLHLGAVKKLERSACAAVFLYLLRTRTFDTKTFRKAYDQFAEEFPEILLDVPEGWTYVFEFLGPLLHDRLLSFKDIWRDSFVESKFVKAFVVHFTKEFGANYVRDLWHKEYKLDLGTIFVKEQKNRVAFFEAHGMQFLFNNSVKPPIDFTSLNTSDDQKIKRLEVLLKGGSNHDLAIDYINTNVNITSSFIKQLTQFICCDYVTAPGNNNNRSKSGVSKSAQLNVDLLVKCCKTLLYRSIDAKEEYELICLDTIFESMQQFHDYHTASELTGNIFAVLYECEVISKDSFDKWYNQQKSHRAKMGDELMEFFQKIF